MVDAKKWHWCKTHEAWGRHTPAECKGKGFRPTKPADDDKFKPPDADKELSPTLRMASALANMALIEDPEDE